MGLQCVVGGVKIGVLGGIGPEATGEFYNKLILSFQKSGLIKSNLDYPQIFVNSVPAPELIGDNISRKDLQAYINGLKELDNLKPDFIVMVCNTIHLYLPILQNEIETPILNLRDEVENYIVDKKIKSSLVIGTLNTVNSGLYRFQGINYIFPTEEEQKNLSDAILNFNNGINKEMQINKTKKICLKYLASGVDIVILGCTEFAVMLGGENFPKINTIDVLVDSVISKFMSLNRAN